MVTRRRLATIALLLAAATFLAGPHESRAQGSTDVVRIPFPRDDGGLTPYTFRLGYPLVTLMYDTLMLRDDGGTPRPWLARSVRRSGLQITIELRRGARWHDGRPLTAEDVVFTFNHVAARPHPRFSNEVRDVARVEARGSHTAVITLRRPSLGFNDQPLADLPILPAHLWRNLPPRQLAPRGPPIGSGPYRLVEYRPNELYRFRANRNYFRGRPRVNEIQVPIIRRADETFEALRRKRVDAIPVSLPGGATTGLDSAGLKLAEGTSYLGVVLMLNVRGAPFNRPELRRAFAQALDLKNIARSVGGAPPAGQTLPAVNGYIHPASRWATAQTLHRYNPQAARVAIAEQAVPPFPILVPRDDPVRKAIGNRVETALQAVGVPTEVLELSQRQLERAVGQDGGAPNFAAAIWSAQPLASYDPSFLRAAFGNPATARLNYSGYRSPAFERLADRVAAAPTVASRKRAVRAQLRQLARDLPVIPLAFPPGSFAFNPDAYDAWSYVQGTGIFDKRSFVAERASGSSRSSDTGGGRQERSPEAPIGDPIDTAASSDDSYLPWLLGGAGLLLVMAAAAIYSRSFSGRR
jgi:peptide/nickel transport system substrate-binding protein